MIGRKKVVQENLFAPPRRETRVSKELRDLRQLVDFDWLREAVVGKFAVRDGRPSIAPEVMGAMLLLGFWFNIASDRELCEECEDRLSFREFMGLSSEDEIPVHSSLTHWRQRLGREVFEQFLKRTLVIAVSRKLVPGRCRVLDSTLVNAQAALGGPSTITVDPVVQADDYLAALGDWEEPVLPGPSEDTDTVAPAASAGPSAKNRRKVRSKQGLLLNTHDIDARVLSHPSKKTAFYHRCHFEFDTKTSLVMAADAGHICEPNKMVEFLSRESYPVDTVMADTGYFSCPTQRWLLERGICSYISVRDNSVAGRGFGLDAFVYVSESDGYICPAGNRLSYQGTSRDGTKRYSTPRGGCVGCEYGAYCFQSGRVCGRRQLSVSPDREMVKAAQRRNRGHRYRRLKVKRSVICEGGISQMKRYAGLGRARWLGTDAMAIQALMSAVVYNLKKVLKWEQEALLLAENVPFSSLSGLYSALRAFLRTIFGPCLRIRKPLVCGLF